MKSNFQDFVNKFKDNNPKQDFEKNFLRIVEDIKNVLGGVKDILVNGKNTTERNTFAVKEAEKDDVSLDIEKSEFGDIKGLLNAIVVNTSKNLPQLANEENRDNYLSSHEEMDKDAKIELDLKKKQFLIFKEQLSVLKEIRDTLNPKVPGELTEQKAKPIDILGADTPSSSNSTSIPDIIRNSGAVVGKTTPKEVIKPKTSKIARVAKYGVGIAAAIGAGSFLYNNFSQFGKEHVEGEIKKIDEDLKAGKISELQAKSLKEEVIHESKKEMTSVVSETTGNIGGGIAGATIGAKMGSVLGPVGAIGGGIAGGVVGSIAGTEAGKRVGDYLNSKDFDEITSDVKEKYQQAKEYIQTELIPEGAKKIEGFINTIRESVNVDKIKDTASKSIDSLRHIIEPETSSHIAKFVGEQPGKFVDKIIKETEKVSQSQPVQEAKAFVNNIVNNQSTNNYIPMKATPRAEYLGSALDRYTDRLSIF